MPGAAIPTFLLALLIAGAPLPGQAEPWDWPFELVPERGRIGVHVQPMTPELREFFEAPPDRGLLVAHVDPAGAAARGGLRVGDVILAAGGAPMRRPFDLVRAVARVEAGGVLELRVLRDAKQRSLRVEPEGDPSPWVDPERWGEWLEEGMRRGGRELRERLRELERRLDELEQRLEREGASRQELDET